MIWSDADIGDALHRGVIIVDPLVPLECIQPASLELELGEPVHLEPGEFRLSHTLQVVTLGPEVAAQLNGKSSWARKGLMIHSTGGWVDPGFSGQIVLELKNIGQKALQLSKMDRVAQLIFHPLLTKCLVPYGHPARDSHYQGQRGNTPSWLDKLDT